MSQTPKILLLSWSIPPGITGSGIIVSNLVKQFTRDEMVVLGAYWMGSPQFTWQRGWPKLYYSGLQPANGLRGERWLRWAQLPLILMRLVWISLVERCDVLFTIYPDMIYLFAGYVGSVLLGKPLIVYFHNTLKEAKPHSTFASWLQSHVFRRASHVFVMSDGMQNLYAENYPALVSSPLRHSFNEPLPVFEHIEHSLNEIHKPLRLAFSGSINSSNFDAVRTVGQVMRELPNAALTIFTGTSRSTLESLGLSQPEIEITSVSRDAIIQKLTEADILLLPHGFTASIADAETRTIFPTNADRDRMTRINT